mgnify:CR=1 FL=1
MKDGLEYFVQLRKIGITYWTNDNLFSTIVIDSNLILMWLIIYFQGTENKESGMGKNDKVVSDKNKKRYMLDL